eukprot:m.192989 g.192989  ORF g.192989 m.192989 type:complete len:105 (-) comp14873_c0_seq1:1703-2017(-)
MNIEGCSHGEERTTSKHTHTQPRKLRAADNNDSATYTHSHAMPNTIEIDVTPSITDEWLCAPKRQSWIEVVRFHDEHGAMTPKQPQPRQPRRQREHNPPQAWSN